MISLAGSRPIADSSEALAGRLQQLQDYATVGKNLFWQRQITFAAALMLSSYYYSWYFSLINCGLIIISEAYDFAVFRKILSTRIVGLKEFKWMLGAVYLGTAASAGIISFYAIWISVLQDSETHFMALFFLFAAALFAAMNNHHVLSVLTFRLTIYGVTFIFIPVRDIYINSAPIQSELWAQLFTSLFVAYFIIDCSRIYLNFYRLTKKQMKELHEEHEVTKAALRAKSEFLSTMSHELRTPLTAIKASVDLVQSGKMGDVSDKTKSVLSLAQRNCKQLVSLINEVLDLQQIESGKMHFKFNDCAVDTLMTEAVETNQPFADKFKVDLILEQPKDELHIKGDKKRLLQVLTNLLSNAAKFSPAGSSVTIRTETQGNRVRFLVIDQGIGLNEADQALVFDRFSQLTASDDRKAEGTGLGLSISKQIVEAHGGRIGYSKNSGPGTTFYFELERLVSASGNQPGDLSRAQDAFRPAAE